MPYYFKFLLFQVHKDSVLGYCMSGDETYANPPALRKIPLTPWALRVYGLDSLSRHQEIQAQITSVLGTILKLDSTKKVKKKGSVNSLLYCEVKRYTKNCYRSLYFMLLDS